MKKELIISSIITFLVIIGVLISKYQTASTLQTSSTLIDTATTQTSTTTQTTSTALTKANVAKHNTANDCWIIINKNAYNVTTYLTDHPGGSEEIIRTCGTDATAAYDAIKGGRGHSAAAIQVLPSLLVGTVQ